MPEPQATSFADDLAAVRSYQGPVMHPPTGREPVTLGELLENPSDAIQRIGALLKQDVTNPRTWIAAAAAYFGAKALPVVVPAIGAALKSAGQGVRAAGSVVEPADVGIISPRAGRMVDLAQRIKGAVTSAAPAEATSPVSSTPAAPGSASVPSAPPPAPQTTAASGSGLPRAKSPQQILNEEAIAARRAKVAAASEPLPEESALYAQLRMSGKTDAEATAGVLAMRQLKESGSFGHLPDNFEAAADMTRRALGGQKSLLGAYAPPKPQ